MSEQLGSYVLEKRIGAGGMADVFLARGPSGVCVIKRPHEHLCRNAEFVRMFLDEAAILAQLHHKGIAQIYDLGQVNGVFYLAMEYVPGFDLMTISLEHERQGELMDVGLCARIVADAAEALHYAHEAVGKNGQPLNIIHRDVSPHNILLAVSGMVKLIDFGVARASNAMHRTQAGLVKGKYPYMSPEQITGQAIDRRADIYALGLVLYELLTNTRAIAGDTEIEQIDNARSARIRPIEQLRPNVPVPIRQIIASCLHPMPEGRYQTAKHLKEDLERFIALERHVVGQEDLLRLFRVVAAEVSHLEPITNPDPGKGGLLVDDTLEPQKKTEVESFGTADLPPPIQEPPLMGMARTEPSMMTPRPQPAIPAGRPLVTPGPIQLDQATNPPGAAHPTLVPLGGHSPSGIREPPASLASQAPVSPSGPTSAPLQLTQPAPAPLPLSAPSTATAAELAAAIPKQRWPMVVAAVSVVILLAVAAKVLLAPKPPPEVVAFDAGLAPLAALPPVDVAPPPEVTPDAAIPEKPPEHAVAPEKTPEKTPEHSPEKTPEKTPPVEPENPPPPEHAPHAAVAGGKLHISTDVAGTITVDGKPYRDGMALPAGKHTALLSNPAEFLRFAVPFTLDPGEDRDLSLSPRKGVVHLEIQPFGRIVLNGKELAPGVSFKEIELYEGSYVFDVSLPGSQPEVKVKAKLQVKAGEKVSSTVQLPVP